MRSRIPEDQVVLCVTPENEGVRELLALSRRQLHLPPNHLVEGKRQLRVGVIESFVQIVHGQCNRLTSKQDLDRFLVR